MMTKWKEESDIASCEEPDKLLHFITKRIPQIHEEGGGTPHDEADTMMAVERLCYLASKGMLPTPWQRAHLRLLARHAIPHTDLASAL